ncbi:MAG: hypothetical protein V4579_05455 [Pseudomonadota bacterium]
MGYRQASVRRGGQNGMLLVFAVLLIAAAALPVMVARYPQMTDYAAHLARYHVMLDLAKNLDLARHYAFAWAWSGNVGVDLVMNALGPGLGVERAGRLVAGAIPALTALAILLVEWVLRRQIGGGALLALAAVWSPSLVLGFLNYTLSLALALLAVALWIATSSRRWRAPVFVAIGVVVYLCHQSGWGVLGVLVFGYELAVQRRLWAAALATWPLWPPLALVAMLGGGMAGAIGYGADPLQWKLTNWLLALAVEGVVPDLLLTALLGGAIMLAAVTRRIDPRIGWAALLLALLSFAMPRHLGGGDFADYRLTAVALMTGCLAIDWPLTRVGLLLCSTPFLLRTGSIAADWHQRSVETEQALAALSHIPRGVHVAAAVAWPAAGWKPQAWSHMACYATVRRDAATNADFAIPGLHMIRLRQPGAFSDPSQMVEQAPGIRPDLSQFAPASGADYLWYFGDRQPAALPPGAAVIFRTANTSLIRLRPTNVSRQTSRP